MLIRFALVALILAAPPVAGSDLEGKLGRSEVRVRAAPHQVAPGVAVTAQALPLRLDRLGYERVHRRPSAPGEYFWGRDVFWIYRRAHRVGGRDFEPALIGLDLTPESGAVAGLLSTEGRSSPLRPGDVWLEPETLAESLQPERAARVAVQLGFLPEHVWRAVLAAEDHRFFAHPGVDPRAIARALVENLREGEIAQGGSTITQQLIKNRDLTPQRTLGRKLSEAIRALALEAEHTKAEILQSYLDHVYLGHAGGLALHGLGTAAQVYFSKPAVELDLGEAAALAGMIRSPNRLSPLRHPKAARARRDQVLERMVELEWATADEVSDARSRPVRARPSPPRRPPASHFLAWVAEVSTEMAPGRIEKGRGLVAETSLDPLVQLAAERAVREGLSGLRRRLGDNPGIGLVALDAANGDVVALVGGGPDGVPGGFDRARQARRQPGSAVKPLLLLEAFEQCGRRDPLYPSARVLDEPVEVATSSGVWSPVNFDQRFRGPVTVRRALTDSLNVPFVRLARWCGFEPTAARMRRAGLPLPQEVPPAFALGAVEVSPLGLAQAYSTLANSGKSVRPRPVIRLERPGGRALETREPRSTAVVSAETAWMVTDLLRDAAQAGTARSATLERGLAAAKTGTSSERRDAWLAGYAGGIVAVVWVGRDDGEPLGLTGSQAAAPVWRAFMEGALAVRPARSMPRPEGIVTAAVDPKTGLRVRRRHPRAELEIFREGAWPRRARWWRADRPVEVVR